MSYISSYTGPYNEAQYNEMRNRDANGYTKRDVDTSSATDASGNSYTTSVSNDQLSNSDFLQLMLQELKLQDPTKPMDSQQMLSTQMQMSSIDTNQKLVESMEALKTSFTQSSLSNASSVIGKNIEDGNVSDTGINKAYTVTSVENVDGQVQVVAREILYIEQRVKLSDGDDSTNDPLVNYDVAGNILDEDGKETGKKIALDKPGTPLVKDGKLVVLDENNEEIADHKYELAGVNTPAYSDKVTNIPFEKITRIF